MRRAVVGARAGSPITCSSTRARSRRIASPQTPIIGGDARDGSIAAASIVAKVHRDARMRELDARYPGYGFARHKGYATRDALRTRSRGSVRAPMHRR